jgi:hypothetical protein
MDQLVKYLKLRDNTWGVIGPGLEPGMIVRVHKNSGEEKSELVAVVLGTCSDGRVVARISIEYSRSRIPHWAGQKTGSYTKYSFGSNH